MRAMQRKSILTMGNEYTDMVVVAIAVQVRTDATTSVP